MGSGAFGLAETITSKLSREGKENVLRISTLKPPVKGAPDLHVNLLYGTTGQRASPRRPQPNVPQFMGVIVCGVDYNGL